MAWTEGTQAEDRGHLCEPADLDVGEIVFFACKHCNQSWLLDHDTDKWVQVP